MKKMMIALTLMSTVSAFAFQEMGASTSVLTAVPFFTSLETGTRLGTIENPARESLAAAREDAIDFLGQNVMSEKLEETIKGLRSSVSELKEATDEEIAALIISI